MPSAAHSPDNAARNAGRVSLVVGVALLGVKAAAAVASGSLAVWSDAAESLVNVAAALFLIFALRVAARPADADHPYGHGKVESFSAGAEGALIFLVALVVIVQAVRDLVAGPELRNLDAGLVLVLAAGFANGALGIYLLRVARECGSEALEADARHVQADAWTSAGVVAGLAAVRLTGWTALDPIVAVAVAVHLLRQGAKIVRRAADNLMDAASPKLLEQSARRLSEARADSWIDIHDLRAWRSGAALHADLHAVVPRYYNAEQLHDIHEKVKDALLADARAGGAVVHFDPCRPSHCASCAMRECPVRGAAFVSRPPLTAASVAARPPEVPGKKSAARI